jgi:hypothetical protein
MRLQLVLGLYNSNSVDAVVTADPAPPNAMIPAAEPDRDEVRFSERAWKSSRMRPLMSYCPPEPGGLTATTTPVVRAVDPFGVVIGPFWLVWAITISPYP